MTTPARLQSGDRFFHVIYEYRCLALAGFAWMKFGPRCTPANLAAIDELLPGAGVIVQDSLLTHARLLIDFFSKPAGGDDIGLADFQLPPLSATRKKELVRYKQPIEVHLLHMTAWRDAGYRRQARATAKGVVRQRIDWNSHNEKIVDLLVRALGLVSRSRRTSWGEPFRYLHQSTQALLSNPHAPWPKELRDKADVNAYLARLGLR